MAAHGCSQRHACRLIEVDPTAVRRAPTADAPEIRQRLRDLAGERRRFGYRRLGILLAREGAEPDSSLTVGAPAIETARAATAASGRSAILASQAENRPAAGRLRLGCGGL